MKGRYVMRQLPPENAAKLLGEVTLIGGGEDPVDVMGWFQRGHLRRVRAQYPNGWRLQFSISPRGIVSRVQAKLSMTIKATQP